MRPATLTCDYRNSRWPPSKKQLRLEDGFQRKLLAILQRTAPIPGESLDDFIQRRRRLATNTARARGLWSSRHVQRCRDWEAHLLRDRNHRSWASNLLRHHDVSWLRTVLLLRDPENSQRGTGTRLHAGMPQPRWQESLHRAIANWDELMLLLLCTCSFGSFWVEGLRPPIL